MKMFIFICLFATMLIANFVINDYNTRGELNNKENAATMSITSHVSLLDLELEAFAQTEGECSSSGCCSSCPPYTGASCTTCDWNFYLDYCCGCTGSGGC